jgi:branched-chain amino acid transport system ATP-binding protein
MVGLVTIWQSRHSGNPDGNKGGPRPTLVDQLHERFEEIPEDGTSVLLVEQDVDAALRLAQRAYVMETGRIVADGTGEQLLNDPRVREAYLGVA